MKRSPRPKFVGFVASTVDGRISLTKNKLPDWTSKEEWKFFQNALKGFEAFVVGRNTYESAAKRLQRRNTYVFSSRPKGIQKRGTVTFVNPGRTNLKKLFAKYKSVAVLGGGPVYCYMAEKKLLDELYVTFEPLVFGRGREMFAGGTKTTRLQLLSAKKLNKMGTMLLHYRLL
jgi:dihydrofolate reductase